MFCQKLGSVFLAHWLASGPDAFDPNLTRPSRFDSGQFCTIWPRPSLEKQNQIGCGKSDPAYTTGPDFGCTLAIMAITGCNQNAAESDPACLLGGFRTLNTTELGDSCTSYCSCNVSLFNTLGVTCTLTNERIVCERIACETVFFK